MLLQLLQKLFRFASLRDATKRARDYARAQYIQSVILPFFTPHNDATRTPHHHTRHHTTRTPTARMHTTSRIARESRAPRDLPFPALRARVEPPPPPPPPAPIARAHTHTHTHPTPSPRHAHAIHAHHTPHARPITSIPKRGRLVVRSLGRIHPIPSHRIASSSSSLCRTCVASCP
jgi:hypothetical protein